MAVRVENAGQEFMRDSKGAYWPIEQVKPIDRARDELVQELAFKAKQLNTDIAEFRAEAFADIAAFLELSAEQYGAKIRGTKGNVTLTSFDGRYKVQRASQDHIVFDERLQAAKALIDECIVEWSKGADSKICILVNSAFEVDKEGNINTGRVLGLRRLDISDAKWQRAMQAISDAVQVTGSKSYIRIYERVGDTDEYRQISLDAASA